MATKTWHVVRVLRRAPGFGPDKWVVVRESEMMCEGETVEDVVYRIAQEDRSKHADYRIEVVL